MPSSWIDLTTTLTIVALILSVWQLIAARRQTQDLKQQTQVLTRVQGALSTKYLGQFPAFLKDVAQIISEARKNIVMIYDLPAYGYYSNYSDWFEIQSAIEEKLRSGVDIKVIVYGQKKREEMLFEQFNFPNHAKWDDWRSRSENKSKLQDFFRRVNYLEGDVNEMDSGVFLNALLQVFRDTVKNTFAGADVLETEAHLPIYVWIADNKKAIFAIPSFADAKTEFGFITEDPSLIAAVSEMFSRYRRRGEGG